MPIPPKSMVASSNPTIHQEVVSLRDYTDVRFAALEKSINDRFVAMDKATAIAYEAQQLRLASMNEIRAQLVAQADTFITHAEVDACTAPLVADIRVLRESKAQLEGKASQQSVNVALLFSIIAAAVALIDLIVMWLP